MEKQKQEKQSKGKVIDTKKYVGKYYKQKKGI